MAGSAHITEKPKVPVEQIQSDEESKSVEAEPVDEEQTKDKAIPEANHTAADDPQKEHDKVDDIPANVQKEGEEEKNEGSPPEAVGESQVQEKTKVERGFGGADGPPAKPVPEEVKEKQTAHPPAKIDAVGKMEPEGPPNPSEESKEKQIAVKEPVDEL